MGLDRNNFNVHLKSEIPIIVVDDDTDTRNCFKQAFSYENYKVFATGGLRETEALLSKLDQKQKYVMVIDYHLEDGNGIELALDLARRAIDSVNILVSCGRDKSIHEHLRSFEETNKKRTGCNCIDEYLDKPVSLHKLIETVEKYL